MSFIGSLGRLGGLQSRVPGSNQGSYVHLVARFPQSPIIQNNLIHCPLFFVLGDIDSLKRVQASCLVEYTKIRTCLTCFFMVRNNLNIFLPDCYIGDISYLSLDHNVRNLKSVLFHFWQS